MNTMMVYLLMLKPALIASIVLIAIPVLLGTWLVPYLRNLVRGTHSGDAQSGYGSRSGMTAK